MKTYFFLNKHSRLIKIGRSEDPERRKGEGQTWIPDLELLGSLEGDQETDLHEQFKAYRQGASEWFDDTKGEIRAFIASQVHAAPPEAIEDAVQILANCEAGLREELESLHSVLRVVQHMRQREEAKLRTQRGIVTQGRLWPPEKLIARIYWQLVDALAFHVQRFYVGVGPGEIQRRWRALDPWDARIKIPEWSNRSETAQRAAMLNRELLFGKSVNGQ